MSLAKFTLGDYNFIEEGRLGRTLRPLQNIENNPQKTRGFDETNHLSKSTAHEQFVKFVYSTMFWVSPDFS